MTSLGFQPKLLFQCDTHSASTRDRGLFRRLSETILQPRKSLPGVSVRRNGSEPNNNAIAGRTSQPTIKWPTKSNEIHTMAADTGYRNHERHQHIYSAADHKSGAKTNASQSFLAGHCRNADCGATQTHAAFGYSRDAKRVWRCGHRRNGSGKLESDQDGTFRGPTDFGVIS
jgi:hypothetical protein